MKKALIVLGLSTLALVGCNNDTGDNVNSILVDIGDLGTGYDLVRDVNTGCVYTREGSGGAHSYPLIPYFGEDGKVVGCGEENLDKSKYE